ncbi:MAG: hypothetical protein H0W86_08515 [Armatimonadetes bacterium]|nr:hypothetical protein [Armatimonadota bacterium]
MLHPTLPGGSAAPNNLRDVPVHWFGLYHAFRDGSRGGDPVEDTAAERAPAYGSPADRNTRTGRWNPGEDPITNFMDYTTIRVGRVHRWTRI